MTIENENTAETVSDEQLLADPVIRQQMIENGMQDLPKDDGEAEQEDAAEGEDATEGDEQEPVPTEAPAPNPDDEDDEPASGVNIPKARFDKEIAKRREAEKEALRLSVQMEEITKALQAYSAQQNGDQPDDNAEIDPLDPETYAMVKKVEGKVDALVDSITKKSNSDKFVNTLSAQEEVFKRDTPDYLPALTHVYNVECNKLIELGDNAETAKAKAEMYLLTMSDKLIKDGKSAPDALYKMAKVMGYKPQGGKADNGKGPNLEKIAENKQKSASIASIPASGSPAPDVDTTEGFKKKYANKHGKTDLNKLVADIERIKRGAVA